MNLKNSGLFGVLGKLVVVAVLAARSVAFGCQEEVRVDCERKYTGVWYNDGCLSLPDPSDCFNWDAVTRDTQSCFARNVQRHCSFRAQAHDWIINNVNVSMAQYLVAKGASIPAYAGMKLSVVLNVILDVAGLEAPSVVDEPGEYLRSEMQRAMREIPDRAANEMQRDIGEIMLILEQREARDAEARWSIDAWVPTHYGTFFYYTTVTPVVGYAIGCLGRCNPAKLRVTSPQGYTGTVDLMCAGDENGNLYNCGRG